MITSEARDIAIAVRVRNDTPQVQTSHEESEDEDDQRETGIIDPDVQWEGIENLFSELGMEVIDEPSADDDNSAYSLHLYPHPVSRTNIDCSLIRSDQSVEVNVY